MKKSIDILLDNDCFTPAQERAIRRKVSYNIVKDQFNKIGVRYQIKNFIEDDLYIFFFQKNEVRREDAYKHVLYKMIMARKVKIKCKHLKKEVRELLNKLDNSELTWENVAKSQELYDLWTRVEADREVSVG